MGRKRQKVRWLSIEESGTSEARYGEEGGDLLLSPPEVGRGSSLSPGSSAGGMMDDHTPQPTRLLDKVPYARRPVAPRFERKAAAGEGFYESSRAYRRRELSGGDSGEDLPLGFTKIRSKNLDVLFKRDYYSTKGGSGGLNSEANTHSETSSLTQKEDEKERDLEEDEDFEVVVEESEEIHPVPEGDAPESQEDSNKKAKDNPKFTSKLNGSSSPFYPSSSPSYVMSMHPPYVTGRPNLFLYSPSSNTMIPCEEVVVPGMYPGSPSTPQNVYLAAFPMEGSNPYMMHHPSSYHPAAHPPIYHQPVYSDAEPSSAESTVPHSPPELSAYNPAYWGDAHSSPRGFYSGYSYENSGYSLSSPVGNQAYQGSTGGKMSVVATEAHKKEQQEEVPHQETESNLSLENRRVPGLPPQPKKSQKKKRKKKNKGATCELNHRDSTSSEEGRTINLIQESSEMTPSSPCKTISVDESSTKSPTAEEDSPLEPVEKYTPFEEINVTPEDDLMDEAPLKEKSPSSSSTTTNNNVELITTEEDPVPEESLEKEKDEASVDLCQELKESCSPSPVLNEEDSPQSEETGEKSSDVHVTKKVEETTILPIPPVEDTIKEKELNPRMLYSSVVSQSMPTQPSPKSSPSHVSKSPSPKSPSQSTLSKAEAKKNHVQESEMEDKGISKTQEEPQNESEWLESSSRKKVKRHRHSKKFSKNSVVPKACDTIPNSQKEPSQPVTDAGVSEEPENIVSLSSPEDSMPQETAKVQEVIKEEEKVEESAPSVPMEDHPPCSPISNKKTSSKKKKNKRDSSKASPSTNGESESSTKQVLIVDGAIDVASSFSSFKRVSDFGNLRFASQLKGPSGGLDTLFISDVGLGIRNGPIMSGRPLRMGKYNPPDRAEEILSMKASCGLPEEEGSSKDNNAQYITLD